MCPAKLYMIKDMPTGMLAGVLSRVYQSEFGNRFLYRHAMHAPEEFQRLHQEFYNYMKTHTKESKQNMIRPIMKDIFFLNQRSEPATEADKQVAVDLLDTLKAHEEGCVGMAANMIGVKKCIIAVNMGFMNMAMFNPKIVKRFGKYETEEAAFPLQV